MKKEQLHQYQKYTVSHIIKNSHAGLFLDMGLGKTISTLTAIDFLIYQDLEIDRVLVIAPKRVAENVWSEEADKWDHTRRLRISKVVGSAKERQAALRADADVYLIGRDNVVWLCEHYKYGPMPFQMLVIDELSSFKNPASKRFRALRKIQPYFHRVVGLTGTPAPNGLIDLWSQIYLLDRGERLGKFISMYRSTFFTPLQTSGHVVYKYGLRPGAEESIKEKIGDICVSMTAKDYLELPEVTFNEIKIPLTPALQKEYDTFEQEMIMDTVESGEGITAANAAVLANKLLQFANGAIYDDSGVARVVHDLKIETTKELIEDSTGPVLIGWTYRHDRDRLMEALRKYSPRELKDGEDIKEWNDGKIKVMMMHPASGGHGLNLQAGGNTILWFGQTWSLELFQQFNARVHRQGQKNGVIIHQLIAAKTMDQDVIAAQKRKDKDQKGLMEAVKARIEKYVN